jgi:hypothetical protein
MRGALANEPGDRPAPAIGPECTKRRPMSDHGGTGLCLVEQL